MLKLPYFLMPSIGVLEHNQKPTDKPTRRIKRSGGQSLVRQGLATWIRENVLLKMRAQIISGKQLINNGQQLTFGKSHDPESGPSQSPRMGKLKWEPPKSKRDFKAHPWANQTFEARIS